MTTTGTRTIGKLLIANRGEIAARIIRSAHALGIATVAVYSGPDAGAPYVTLAGEAVRLPGAAPADTYLRGDLVIAAAAAAGAGAVHPGYGFLSENAAFARACADAGPTKISPAAETIAAMMALAVTLSPIAAMVPGAGPTKISPASAQARANGAFSDRKPYPGWTAPAPVAVAAAMMRSPRR